MESQLSTHMGDTGGGTARPLLSCGVRRAGRLLQKHLSQLLVVTLLLLAPLSFSTDSIPDFKPACDISATSITKIVVAAIDSSAAPPSLPSDPAVAARYVLPSTIGPVDARPSIPSFGRAPPA